MLNSSCHLHDLINFPVQFFPVDFCNAKNFLLSRSSFTQCITVFIKETQTGSNSVELQRTILCSNWKQTVKSYPSPFSRSATTYVSSFYFSFLRSEKLICSLIFTFVDQHHSIALVNIFLVIIQTFTRQIAIFSC